MPDFSNLNIQIPQPVERGNFPDPEVLRFYSDREQRVFNIFEDIEDTTLWVIQEIIRINEEDRKNNVPIEQRKPIKLRIFTPGGLLYVGFALIDVITCSTTPVWTYNMGMCASCGLLIFLAGSRRFTFKRGSFLMHSGSRSGGADTCTLEQQEQDMKQWKNLVTKMREFFMERSKVTEKEFAKNKDKEWWIWGDEAVNKYGIATDLIDSVDSL